MQRTEIESLGEFGLIRRLTEQTVLRQPSSLLGIGDDAAVINPEGKRVVVSTDMLVEGFISIFRTPPSSTLVTKQWR